MVGCVNVTYLGSGSAVLASLGVVINLDGFNLFVLAQIQAVDVLLGGRSLGESLSSRGRSHCDVMCCYKVWRLCD